MLVEPTPHNLRKGCAGERSLSRRSMGFCLACPPCTSCDASSLAPYLPPRSTGGTYPTCARPMDTCKPRPTGTSCSPSRPTVASSRSISKSAGTSSTHSLQAVPIRSPTAQDKLHACAYELHAHTRAGCPHTVAGTSTLSSARRYTRCVPRWAPASRRKCCGHAPITIVRVVRVGS